jgi:hypothetical protein
MAWTKDLTSINSVVLDNDRYTITVGYTISEDSTVKETSTMTLSGNLDSAQITERRALIRQQFTAQANERIRVLKDSQTLATQLAPIVDQV